ncbi:hypothetical protein [Halorarius halobius]|uniref:hypothetical protein n=1 Tax=Halorarius halobius TaxID=2962671 RepID=UPI0020CCEC21|nr:hypothetical protein [Halorarius halobius]
MLRLVEQSVENVQSTTAALIGLAAGLEDHEQDAVEGFLKNPNGRNVNTLATYASVEHEMVEETFDAIPDALVWKEEGKWQLVLADPSVSS